MTIGGAIASDIHGKNHHVDGSFGDHVLRCPLLLADGSVVELGPDRRPELFWATVGGMGLTGVILDATVRLLPHRDQPVLGRHDRAPDLDDVLALMDERRPHYRYSVAWIDLMAKGARLGRSVLTRGDHATADQLVPRDAVDPLAFDAAPLVAVPPLVPPAGLLNHPTVAAFNELWYRKAPRRRVGERADDLVLLPPARRGRRWNRLYGRPGFVQYQFVVPFGAGAALRTVVERLAGSGTASFLAVLKRFGAGDPARSASRSPGGRWRSTCRRAAAGWPGCCTSSTRSCSTPVVATTWPRTRTRRPGPSAGATPAWPSGRRCGPRSTRPASGRAT